MKQLGATDYFLKGPHTNGPIGERYVVRSEAAGRELLADIAVVDDDKYLRALCQNALKTKRWTDDRSVANVLEAGWLPDGRYFQVLQMSPRASTIFDPQKRIFEPQLWMVAQSLVAGVRHMHRSELVHGTISPACIYRDGDEIRLGELWFAHNADGDPLFNDLSNFFSPNPPEHALPFMSPEVLLGYPPRRESDIFSLGAVLFYLLTGQTPRDLPPPYPDEAAREALAEAPMNSLAKLRPDLSRVLEGLIMSMMMIDPGARPTIFLLEGICADLVNGPARDDETVEESMF